MNVLTEFSNGKIQAWNCTLDGATDVNSVYPWLTQVYKLDTLPEGKCFILHYSVFDGPIANCPLLKNGTKEFENGYYTIWTFESVDAMLAGVK